jgi:hypothetical protein
MYVIIGKQNCIQCDELKNLLDEKGIQYNYLDMTEMPNKTMTYLRMYCNSFPIVASACAAPPRCVLPAYRHYFSNVLYSLGKCPGIVILQASIQASKCPTIQASIVTILGP